VIYYKHSQLLKLILTIWIQFIYCNYFLLKACSNYLVFRIFLIIEAVLMRESTVNLFHPLYSFTLIAVIMKSYVGIDPLNTGTIINDLLLYWLLLFLPIIEPLSGFSMVVTRESPYITSIPVICMWGFEILWYCNTREVSSVIFQVEKPIARTMPFTPPSSKPQRHHPSPFPNPYLNRRASRSDSSKQRISSSRTVWVCS